MSKTQRANNSDQIFWGLFLLAAGTILLLSRLGISDFDWTIRRSGRSSSSSSASRKSFIASTIWSGLWMIVGRRMAADGHAAHLRLHLPLVVAAAAGDPRRRNHRADDRRTRCGAAMPRKENTMSDEQAAGWSSTSTASRASTSASIAAKIAATIRGRAWCGAARFSPPASSAGSITPGSSTHPTTSMVAAGSDRDGPRAPAEAAVDLDGRAVSGSEFCFCRSCRFCRTSTSP